MVGNEKEEKKDFLKEFRARHGVERLVFKYLDPQWLGTPGAFLGWNPRRTLPCCSGGRDMASPC